MRVVTGPQMAEIDRITIHELGLPGRLLMESAGRATAACCLDLLPRPESVVAVVCGPGNNGGDGFVVARTLVCRGIDARVLLSAAVDRYRGDALANLEAARAFGVPVVELSDAARAAQHLAAADLAVDALFGTGLSRPLRGFAAELVELLNRSELPVVSVDIPSGIDSATGQVLGCAVRAQATVTFGLPKVGLLLHPGATHAGELSVAEIGFPHRLIEDPGIDGQVIDRELVAPLLPRRSPTAHKGSCGRALLVVGSHRYPGAAALAGMGCLRGGAGLVYISVPEQVKPWTETSLLEAIILGTREPQELREWAERAQAVCLGPGLGDAPETLSLVRELLDDLKVPAVVDADGLKALPCPSPHLVLTPHPGEMGAMMGVCVADVEADRLGWATRAAQRFGATVILKGAPTVVACVDGRFWINTSGGPILSQGGTGDVLAGLVTALLAQGLEPASAAVCGVYLHGLAGDACAQEIGPRGVPAHQVAEAIPTVLGELLG